MASLWNNMKLNEILKFTVEHHSLLKERETSPSEQPSSFLKGHQFLRSFDEVKSVHIQNVLELDIHVTSCINLI